MKKLTLLLLTIVSMVIIAQTDGSNKPLVQTRARYYQDFLAFASDEQGFTRLDIFIQVPYTEVQFVISDNGFSAAYNASISIYDEKKDKLIAEKTWEEKITAPEFNKTNSKYNFNLSLKSFKLVPGKYFIRTSVEDKESKKSFASENPFTVKDFSGSVSVSDIMLIAKQTNVEGSNKLVPNVSRNVTEQKGGVPLFFEIYSDTSRKIYAEVKVLDDKSNVSYLDRFEKELTKGRNQAFYTIKDSAISLGKYLIELSLKNDIGQTYSSSGKTFLSRWLGVPSTVEDLDKAISQLMYIATGEELDFIKEGATKEEKASRYKEFWKKKDPVPTTEENEIFDEYYRRIEYANEQFTHYTEGWKTDRGMVYILLGAPNNVDRHPFDYDSKPYEVWDYYEMNKSFVFMDETGFGDYRLVTPLYGNEYRYR